MKKILIISIIVFTSCNNVFSQKQGDRKIIVNVSDTSNIYTKVKLAIIKAGFIVRDDMNTHTLTTNVTVKKILGYTVIKAEINNNTVTIWGVYSNKNKNLLDVEIAPGKYRDITYFKNNSGYGGDFLYAIAAEIDAHDLTFSK
jgi:hypothetical protein